MRVTFLVPGYVRRPSGGIRIVYEYANHLVSRGHSVCVVHPRKIDGLPHHGEVKTYDRLRNSWERWINTVTTPTVKWQMVDPRVMLLYVPSLQPRFVPESDVVFATGWSTVYPLLQYPSSKGVGCYLVQGDESYCADRKVIDDTWQSRLRKVVIARWLERLGLQMGCNDIFYVPNAIDHRRYRLVCPLDTRPMQVAMMFSSARIKGAAEGIEALRIVRQRYPNLRVVMFGASRATSLIPPWVEYHRDPDQDVIVSHIYNRSSIFLAPSWTEGSPLPPLEAAACGCAIAATDIEGFREHFHDGASALLAPPRDPRSLANNLLCLLGDDVLRLRLAQAALEVAAQRDWDRSIDLLEQFLTLAVRKRDALSESTDGVALANF